ncbi:MAG: hypothetical protein RLZZ480_488 [Candidatus Parcubacteria bacterium]|jgi:hypothetical protein
MRTNPHNSMNTKPDAQRMFCVLTSYIGAAPAVSSELWPVDLMA